MLGKIRKMLKILPKVFIVMGSVSVALAMLLSMVSEPAQANTIQTQETCPKDEGWTKVDGLTGKSYSFNSSSDKLIVEWCYKASTTVKYGSVNPPSSSYTVESSVNDKNQEIQNLSDASFRLIDGSPTNTPIMKETQISTPSSTPVFDGPIPTNTPTNMPEHTLTNTPTSTPVFDGPIPTNTPTNTPEPTLTNTSTSTPVFDGPIPTNTPTNTPEPSPTNTPTNTPIFDNPIPTYRPTNTPEPTLTNTSTSTPVFDGPIPTNTPTNTPEPTLTNTPTSTPVFDGPIPTNTQTNTPEPTLTNTPTITPIFDNPIPTYRPTNTPEPTLTNTPTNTPVLDGPTPIPDYSGQTPTPNDTGLTSTPDVDETTYPIIAPTFSPPRNNDLLTLLIPVTGSESNGISPLEKVRSLLFNFGLIIFGFGLVFQSIRKKLNL
jgi:hypothetical protein